MRRIATAFVLALGVPAAAATTPTVGLLLYTPRAAPGYTLFAPLNSTRTFLVDDAGFLVHAWPSTARPGQAAYLLENGNLLRAENAGNPVFDAGGAGGRLVELDWEGTVAWSFTYSSALHCQHHDARRLPNGNTLLIAWESMTRNAAIAAGRKPGLVGAAGLWPDHLVEVRPDGAIAWEWHAWDHLVQDADPTKANYGVVADHPELIDVNATGNGADPDWLHTNSVDYDPTFDQVLVSVHNLGEIWVVDHGTTTAQAAGHTGGRSGKGGDLLYRWGNPAIHRRGTAADRKLFGQHDAQWITRGNPGAGDITIFNNGLGRTGGVDWSSVDEITPPVDAEGRYALAPGAAYGPAALTWTYAAPNPTDFYSDNVSGAQRLSNGNTLICSGRPGIFFEVDAAGSMTWKYVNPVGSSGAGVQGREPPVGNNVFKIRRYGREFPGLRERVLAAHGTVERHDPAVPPMVADGKLLGAAARFSRAAQGQIDVTWDASACTGSAAAIVYGVLGAFEGYAGCAQPDAGNAGSTTIDAAALGNTWFDILWTSGGIAGHPGYGFDGVADVARRWSAAGWCGITADDPTRNACP